MANSTSNLSKSSSSNYYQATKDVAARSNIQASAYTIDAASMELNGFHYSTCGAGGTYKPPSGPGGGFEVSTGIPSPPPSPRAAPFESSPVRPGLKARSRSGGAAYTIAEECERLFCETLKAVFLGEGNTSFQDSLVMGVRNNNGSNREACVSSSTRYSPRSQPLPTPSPSADGFIDFAQPAGAVKQWIEIWDYAGGVRFRGFIADKNGRKALFVFFDNTVVGKDLKHGLMSLLELSGGQDFECSELVVCLDRTADQDDIKDLTRDLGWVGFELMTLGSWSGDAACTSDRWIFLEMEV
ncbi:hypothetical protein MBLNU459_g6802t1 [Dothideomycetes sp. NU459]